MLSSPVWSDQKVSTCRDIAIHPAYFGVGVVGQQLHPASHCTTTMACWSTMISLLRGEQLCYSGEANTYTCYSVWHCVGHTAHTLVIVAVLLQGCCCVTGHASVLVSQGMQQRTYNALLGVTRDNLQNEAVSLGMSKCSQCSSPACPATFMQQWQT